MKRRGKGSEVALYIRSLVRNGIRNGIISVISKLPRNEDLIIPKDERETPRGGSKER